MRLIVSNIVEVSMNKIALWINDCVDDWSDERAIITSNGKPKLTGTYQSFTLTTTYCPVNKWGFF